MAKFGEDYAKDMAFKVFPRFGEGDLVTFFLTPVGSFSNSSKHSY